MQAAPTLERPEGVDWEIVDALIQQARHTVSKGELPSLQLAVAHLGKLITFETFGTINDGEPATNHSLYVAFSTTKAVMSVASWLLMEDGLLDPSEKVSETLPGFVTPGKRSVEVQHLLTHTAGFPNAPFSPLDWENPARRAERFAQWKTQWEPGTRFVYHPAASMWVLADLIEKKSGMDYRQFVSTRIAQPLGLADLHIGLTENEHHRVALIQHVGERPEPDMIRNMGLNPNQLPDNSQETWLSQFDKKEFRTIGSPGAGGIMTAASLALFYQGVMGHLKTKTGMPLLKSNSVARGLTPLTKKLTDPMTGQLANRGLGLVIAGDDTKVYRGFAPTHSARAFGHPGAGGQVAWADPATGLSFALLTNGLDRNPLRLGMRAMSFSNQIAQCAPPLEPDQEIAKCD